MRTLILKSFVLAVLAVSPLTATAQQATGKLRVEILPFSSEIELKEKVMAFTIKQGKTTTVKVRPVIRKNATFFLNFFLPELLVSIAQEGAEFGPEVSVIAKTESSVPWPAYNGPLKFQATK